MTTPTFSADGQWMWDGNGWIPAPPQSHVLPPSSINQQQVSSVAKQTGVPPNQLTQAAPYFDQNQDGVLQQAELQQAAMAISQAPTAPVPVYLPQPVMQQPVMQQPVAPVTIQPQMVQLVTEGKRPNMGIIGCVLILMSIAMPYVPNWLAGYELIEISWELASNTEAESVIAIIESFAEGSSEGGGDGEGDSLRYIGGIMFLIFPIWNCFISIISLLGAGSKKAVKHMKGSGVLHFLYVLVMLVCCFIAFGDLIFDFMGIGIWVSILGGIMMTLD